MSRLLLCLAVIGMLPILAGCENSAVSYSIDGGQHAIVLVREQNWVWDSTVNQAVIISRLPECQRRVTIHPGSTDMVPMEVFKAGDLLWALRQGRQWYLASTERCLVQDWNNQEGQPPGALVGTFLLKDGKPAFVPAQ